MSRETRILRLVVQLCAVMISWAGPGATAVVPPSPPKPADQEVTAMKIRLRVDQRSITATLADSQAAREFASLLPLDLTLTDYAATEKISDLPKRLSTEGAPAGIDPSAGDLAYYSPWGNLALFYKDGHYSKGLVKLARLDAGIDVFDRAGSVRVTIEPVSK